MVQTISSKEYLSNFAISVIFRKRKARYLVSISEEEMVVNQKYKEKS